jgi:hypothetical protein
MGKIKDGDEIGAILLVLVHPPAVLAINQADSGPFLVSIVWCGPYMIDGMCGKSLVDGSAICGQIWLTSGVNVQNFVAPDERSEWMFLNHTYGAHGSKSWRRMKSNWMVTDAIAQCLVQS